jgi:hypothetical protein
MPSDTPRASGSCRALYSVSGGFYEARMRVALLLVASLLVAGCGSNGSGPGTGGGSGTSDTKCYDESASPTDQCAITLSPDVCSLGDANSCVPLTKVEIFADDGMNGVCVHLVFENQCSSEIFADTCIEHQDPGATQLGEQCWTSSVTPGFTIDVSQCHATGKYFFVSTTSSGSLDIDEQKCPAPTPM